MVPRFMHVSICLSATIERYHFHRWPATMYHRINRCWHPGSGLSRDLTHIKHHVSKWSDLLSTLSYSALSFNKYYDWLLFNQPDSASHYDSFLLNLPALTSHCDSLQFNLPSFHLYSLCEMEITAGWSQLRMSFPVTGRKSMSSIIVPRWYYWSSMHFLLNFTCSWATGIGRTI